MTHVTLQKSRDTFNIMINIGGEAGGPSSARFGYFGFTHCALPLFTSFCYIGCYCCFFSGILKPRSLMTTWYGQAPLAAGFLPAVAAVSLSAGLASAVAAFAGCFCFFPVNQLQNE